MVEEGDEDSLPEVKASWSGWRRWWGLEFRRIPSGEMDGCFAYLDILGGFRAPGDWAEMMLRMYLLG